VIVSLAEGYLTDGSINVAILKFKNDQAADKPEGSTSSGCTTSGSR
jgi:hypothetical protein